MNPDAESRKAGTGQELAKDENAEVPVLVPRPSEAEISAPDDPELARALAAWGERSDAIRAAILALVDTSHNHTGGDHE